MIFRHRWCNVTGNAYSNQQPSNMKTKIFPLLAGFVLVATAQAGTPTTPAPGVGLWKWFVGGSVGYLTDQDEVMYNLQAGAEYKAPGARGSHAIYLEVGFTQDDDNHVYDPGLPGSSVVYSTLDLNMIPITLNYKYEATLSGRLNYYLGLGLGIAILDCSYDWHWTPPYPPFNTTRGSDDQTDVRFYGDVFAGLTYDVSDSFEIFAGVRYIFMDNVDRHIDVTNVPDYEAGINNTVLFELGVRINF